MADSADSADCRILKYVLAELKRSVDDLSPREWTWECLSYRLSKHFNRKFVNSHRKQILGHFHDCLEKRVAAAFRSSQMEAHSASPALCAPRPMAPLDSKRSSISSVPRSSRPRSPDRTLGSRIECGSFRVNPGKWQGVIFSFSDTDELNWIDETYISQRGLGTCVRNDRITLEFSFDSNLRRSYKLEFHIKKATVDAQLGTKWDVVDSGSEKPRQKKPSSKTSRRVKSSKIVSNTADAAKSRQVPGLKITVEVSPNGLLQIPSSPSTHFEVDPLVSPSSDFPRIPKRNNIRKLTSTEGLQLSPSFPSPSTRSSRRGKERDSDDSSTTDSELWDEPNWESTETSESSAPNSRDGSRDRFYPLGQHKYLEEEVLMNPWKSLFASLLLLVSLIVIPTSLGV